MAVGAPALDAADNATGEEGLERIELRGDTGERKEEGQKERESAADWYYFSGY